ncbi:MarR family winged helix-turn-helix transcriptional regulator [Alkalibacillus haloalkaliphilus]|uniref:MarR family transcriptional regulator n=1 Tax=Alkalibacillus haloalkaliphilus TaxID=94136 RepID=A0A511W500_9BACI|nr:MarR family transcriptional regulator [Alkalibacillus haloalkaliphilus]GEN46176.1 MarR family transcriptional regulator [Alkalibacillus haloalkaliphilus]
MENDNLAKEINKNWTDIYYLLHYKHQENLSHQVIRLLQHIKKIGNCSVSELAELLDVTHNTASEHIKRLTSKGLVVKKRSSNDERRVVISLTDNGELELHKHTHLDESKLNKVLDNLSVEEKNQVEQAFSLLRKEVIKCFS